MEETTTIRISQATKKRLDALGKKGDTHDNIVTKLFGQSNPPKTSAEALARLSAIFDDIWNRRIQAQAKWLSAHKILEALPESTSAEEKKQHENARKSHGDDVRALDQFIEALKSRLAAWPPG